MSLPSIECFPVVIPVHFAPSDSEGDGPDRRWDAKGTLCPGQDPADGFRPRLGSTFYATRGAALHAAVDIMAAEGAEVRSIGAGVVAGTWTPRAGVVAPGAGWSDKGGHYVVVLDGASRWYYAHLRDAPLVEPGARVAAGQILGFVGRTGNAVRRIRRRDGTTYLRGCPHLHLGLKVDDVRGRQQARAKGIAVEGSRVDPWPLLEPLYVAGGWWRR